MFLALPASRHYYAITRDLDLLLAQHIYLDLFFLVSLKLSYQELFQTFHLLVELLVFAWNQLSADELKNVHVLV